MLSITSIKPTGTAQVAANLAHPPGSPSSTKLRLQATMTPVIEIQDFDHKHDRAIDTVGPEASRTATSTEEINSTITRPGSVKINVKGAFIVDPDAATPAVGTGSSQSNGRGSPTHHETRDIRLPNHTAVVSHIAVDVRERPNSCRDTAAGWETRY